MVKLTRLPVGIVIGIFFSFIGAWAFSNWAGIEVVVSLLQTNLTTGLYTFFGKQFSSDLDIISFFMTLPTDIILIFTRFFSSTMMAWIFTGGIAGCIVKGVKRGILAASIIFVINFLIWILIGIISGVDLISLFAGDQLISTLGTIIGGVIGVLIGGFLFGLISGPYEEIL